MIIRPSAFHWHALLLLHFLEDMIPKIGQIFVDHKCWTKIWFSLFKFFSFRQIVKFLPKLLTMNQWFDWNISLCVLPCDQFIRCNKTIENVDNRASDIRFIFKMVNNSDFLYMRINACWLNNDYGDKLTVSLVWI